MQFSRLLTQQAIVDMQRGNWQEADRQLTQAIRQAPENAEARRHYAEVLWQCGKQEEAIAQLETAVRLAEGDAGMHIALAQKLLARDALAPAERHIARAIALDASSAEAWITRATLYQKQGRWQDALADLHRAAGLRPDDRQVLMETAHVHNALGQSDLALASLQAAAETCRAGEEPPDLLYALGTAYLANHRYQDAAGALARAMQKGCRQDDVAYLLATAYWAEGDAAAARQAAQLALQRNPHDARTQELMDRMRRVAGTEPPVRR